MHCRAHRSKVAASWCCLNACYYIGFGGDESCGRRSALQTLLLSAALLHEKVPLMSFLALRSVLKNTLIREMSIQARSCTLQADSGSQSVLFDESVQSDLMILERQVQATIHFCSLLDGGTCHKTLDFVWQISLTHDDGYLCLTRYRKHSKSFLG